MIPSQIIVSLFSQNSFRSLSSNIWFENLYRLLIRNEFHLETLKYDCQTFFAETVLIFAFMFLWSSKFLPGTWQ